MQIPTDMLQTQGIFKVVEDGISQNIGVLLGFKKKDICSRIPLGDPKFWKPRNPWNPWSPVRVKPQPPMGGCEKTPQGLRKMAPWDPSLAGYPERRVQVYNYCIPAPSKGCQMVPKGYQISIP